jgi:L,D-transpeptidase catalytic domain
LSRRSLALGLAVVAVGLATAAAVAGLSRDEPDASPARPRPESPAPRSDRRPIAIPAGYSIVAHSRRPTVAVYARPQAAKPMRELPHPNANGGPLVFLVDWSKARWTRPTWVRVRLPVRPNGSVGWVRSSDLRFLLNAFRVQIDLTDHEITVWRGSRRVARERIGVGRALTPTPVGMYFLSELINVEEPDGLYGPYAFGTSAYSPVLTNFGGGPGQIGIHGTNRPDLLGTDVSHGCIRLRNAAITRLARLLPLGTPVEISR